MVQSSFLCYSSNLLAPSILWEEFPWIRLCCFVHPLGHICLSGFNDFVLCWPGAGHIIAVLFVYGPLGTHCFLKASAPPVCLSAWQCDPVLIVQCTEGVCCQIVRIILISPGTWVLEGLSSALRWQRAWPGPGWLGVSKVAPALQCDQFSFNNWAVSVYSLE